MPTRLEKMKEVRRKSILGIIIPVYNEAENIGRTLRAVKAHVSTPYRIHIVYDFTEDNTLPVARDVAQKEDMDIHFMGNHAAGVIGAIKTGLREAAEDYLLVTMADLSDDYSVVDEMCRLMSEGYDLVCGSRYAKGGRQIGGPLIKKTLSRLAGLSLKLLAGIPTSDATNSFKLYRKTMLDGIRIESDGGFEIGIELLVKAHFSGHRIAEIPCTWTARQKGKSRFRILRWMPKYMRWYVYALKKAFFGVRS